MYFHAYERVLDCTRNSTKLYVELTCAAGYDECEGKNSNLRIVRPIQGVSKHEQDRVAKNHQIERTRQLAI